MTDREQEQQNEQQRGPGLVFAIVLVMVMLGTVWLSSHQTIAAWQKPPMTKEEYERKMQAQMEQLKAMNEQAKADTKSVAALLVKDARAALVKKDYPQAISLADKVLAADADNSGAYLARGIAYYQTGKLNEALQDLSKAAALAPRSAEALTYRGLVKNKQGQPQAAIDDFTEAIRRNSQYGSAYYYRAMLREHTGQAALAQDDFKKACELKIQQACDKVK